MEIKTRPRSKTPREDLLLHLGADYFFIHDVMRSRREVEPKNGRRDGARKEKRGTSVQMPVNDTGGRNKKMRNKMTLKVRVITI